MKVKDLIELLSQCDQEAEAYVWDAYADCESKTIRVSVTKDGQVHIDVNAFGRDVSFPAAQFVDVREVTSYGEHR